MSGYPNIRKRLSESAEDHRLRCGEELTGVIFRAQRNFARRVALAFWRLAKANEQATVIDELLGEELEEVQVALVVADANLATLERECAAPSQKEASNGR